MPLIVAHFFVFYYAELSAITPPVAIGCLVASGLAGAKFMKTCLTSMRLAIAGFVLPFLFLYRPAILLQGAWYETIWAVAMVVCFLFMFIIAVEDFFLQKTTVAERLLAGMSAFCLLMPVAVLDFAGIALAVIMLVLHITRYKKQPPVAQEA